MAVRLSRTFGGFRWREISRRQSRSILHGILFGFGEGRHWLKARGGVRRHEKLETLHESFLRWPFFPRFACLKIREREREREKKLALPSAETPSYEDTFGLLFLFFLF